MALSHSPSIVTDGLVLCLDAANLKSYPGSGTTWFDISGRENNFLLLNSPTFLGNRFSLDAANSNFRSINTINFNAKTLTIQFLFRPKTYVIGSTGKMIFELSENFNSNQESFGHYYVGDDGNSIYLVNSSSSGYNYSLWDKSFYNDLGWKFVNCVLDRNISGRQNFLYTQATERTPSSTPSASGNSNNFGNYRLYIGSRGNNSLFADLEISYFSIYTKVLNQSEISQNFNALRGRFNI